MSTALDRVASAELDQPHGELRQLVAGWLLAQRSAHTRKAYGLDLAAWSTWLDHGGVRLLEAQRPHADGWARQLEADGAAPATIARKLAAVSSFYSYAVDEGVIEANPLGRVRRPQVSDESPTLGLDRAQAIALIDAAERLGHRAHLLVVLLLTTGLRISEALALDLADVEMVRGHCTVRVTGKGGRVARVVLPPVVCDLIAADGRDAGPMFVTRTGRAMVAGEAGRIIARAARMAGIAGRITPHSLRHSAVTLALDAGVSLRDVQDFARHADPRTTRRYDRARGALDRNAAYTLANVLARSAS